MLVGTTTREGAGGLPAAVHAGITRRGLVVGTATMFRQRGVLDPWDVHKGQWTWDDFVDALTKLSREGVTGFKIDGHNLERGYQMFIATNGGEYFDREQMRYTLDRPKTIEVMEWLLDLSRRRLMLTPREQSALSTETAVGLVQSNGNSVFAKGKHPEEGYDFVKFLGGEEIQGALGVARIVQPAFHGERSMREALLEANRIGNLQVEYKEKCFKPP